jgi:excisionase family DNA binding protein
MTAAFSLPESSEAHSPALLDVRAVAALLGCSARHIYRLSDSGRMPRPVKLGALVRWSRASIDEWLAAGCPAVRRVFPKSTAAKAAPSLSH